MAKEVKRQILGGLAAGRDVSTYANIRSLVPDHASNFMQVFVLEVISDPKIVTKQKVEYWEKVLKLTLNSTKKFLSGPDDSTEQDPTAVEQNLIRFFPRNTIIAQKRLTGGSRFTSPMLLYPFFPSHLSLPCKPGELVWALYEDANIGGEKLGYWMCSVVQPYFVEDVNHTHMPFVFRPHQTKKSSDAKIPYELRNGVVKITKDEEGNLLNNKGFVAFKTDIASQVLNNNEEDIFEKLILTTDAGKISTFEAIPRFHKRPGDLALEGSNNSLIVLGTQRNGPLANFQQGTVSVTTTSEVKPVLPGLVPIEMFNMFNSGMIDLVVGRGYTEKTGGKPITVTSLGGFGPIKQEIDKLNLSPNEGDLDFFNDRSRIQISQRTTPDSDFKLNEYFSNKMNISDDTAGEGDAAVVIKSDKIRLIARSDISFVVTNYVKSEAPNNSNIKHSFKNEVEDQKQWASITIRSNGDIIFTPSETGLIKLGGDDADKAILCTDNLDKKPVTKNGKVTYPVGLISTGADLIGTGNAKQGTFATKILVK